MNVNGNAVLLNDITVKVLENTVRDVLLNKECLDKMKFSAQGKPMELFSYKNIALKSIGIVE